MSNKDKATKNYMAEGMSLGICFGMAVGAAIKKIIRNNTEKVRDSTVSDL